MVGYKIIDTRNLRFESSFLKLCLLWQKNIEIARRPTLFFQNFQQNSSLRQTNQCRTYSFNFINPKMEKPDGSKYVNITEGRATVLYEDENQVFYNPVQQFNRDLSTCAIRAWSTEFMENKSSGKRNERRKRKRESQKQVDLAESESHTESDNIDLTNSPIESTASESKSRQPFITILEALSATGLRAIRYGLEIPYIKRVVANDFSPAAVNAINRNIAFNDGASKVVVASQGDANSVMYTHKTQPFHCIDLDPYGTAAPFLDSAVQSICDGGLLLVTCTDLSILAGTGYPEKCFSNYGGMTCRTEFSHEAALRLVLGAISSAAGRYGKSIEPLLSLSIDFYVRLFVRVRNSPATVKLLAHNTMITYTCSGCGSTTTQRMGKSTLNESQNIYKHTFAQGPTVSPQCEHCGFVHHIGGPMWAGPLHNKSFIENILCMADSLDKDIYKTVPRIKGMLTLANEELDVPFYFTAGHVSSVLHCTCPPMTIMTSALLNAGYKVSATHASPGAIKTDAPWSVIWDVLREWIKKNPVKLENIKENAPGRKILQKREPSFEVDFTSHPEANPPSRKFKIIRYPQNPPNWGPKAKAKGDQPYHNDKIQGPGALNKNHRDNIESKKLRHE
ncbi:N2,N2-dimethylguanosine tRNA methyltransferase-domain-containing protein [Dipodascopsis uninucleata]